MKTVLLRISILFGSVLWPVTIAGQGGSAITLRVVDRGAQDAPIPGVDVHVVDSSQKYIASGITNADGEFVFPARAGQAFSIQYQKLGYVRRPDTVSVTGKPGPQRVDGPLIKNSADRAYYVALGKRIESAAGNAQVVQPADVARVKELSTNNQSATIAALSPKLQAQLKASTGSDLRDLDFPRDQGAVDIPNGKSVVVPKDQTTIPKNQSAIPKD